MFFTLFCDSAHRATTPPCGHPSTEGNFQAVLIPLCGGVARHATVLPSPRIYPFQNEAQISNRDGNLYLIGERLRLILDLAVSRPGSLFARASLATAHGAISLFCKGIGSRFHSRRLFQFLWIGVIEISSLRNGSPHRGLYFETGIAA